MIPTLLSYLDAVTTAHYSQKPPKGVKLDKGDLPSHLEDLEREIQHIKSNPNYRPDCATLQAYRPVLEQIRATRMKLRSMLAQMSQYEQYLSKLDQHYTYLSHIEDPRGIEKLLSGCALQGILVVPGPSNTSCHTYLQKHMAAAGTLIINRRISLLWTSQHVVFVGLMEDIQDYAKSIHMEMV